MEQPLANPYQPPQSNVEGAAVGGDLVEASKGRRFGTLVIDYIGFMVWAFIVGIILGLVFGERWAEALQSVPDFVFGAAVLFVYYTFFETLWARTPGKMVFGTRVVTEAGTPPGFGQVAKRTVCRFIPFEPFSFLGARGWHDSLSKTRVVMVRRS